MAPDSASCAPAGGDSLAGFAAHLEARGFSENTVVSYAYAAGQLVGRCGESPSAADLAEHREWLEARYSPKSVNLRVAAVNAYLEWSGAGAARMAGVRERRGPFLEGAVTMAGYERMRDASAADGDPFWHFAVRFLACTGARVSELRQLTCASVREGFLDVVGKGGKPRRVWVPARLRADALAWVGEREGWLFAREPGGRPMTARGIALGLKRLAARAGVDPGEVHPHAFRHLFARGFIRANPDIALLADLMGHESIETTRLYLRRTADEQREAVDEAVTW